MSDDKNMPIPLDTKLGEITILQFADLLEFKGDVHRAQLAEKERILSERVFADIDGVRNLAHPFRMRSKKDVREFTKQLEEFIDASEKGGSPKCEFVVAMAIVSPDGEVTKMPWDE